MLACIQSEESQSREFGLQTQHRLALTVHEL
jgi:hypothetical protein